MSLKPLTDLQIQKLPVPDSGQRVYYEPSGLGIRVSQGGTKSFVVQVGKSRKRFTLGKYPKMTLKIARKEAMALLEAEDTDKHRITAQKAISGFLEHCEQHNRPRTVADYRRLLNRHFPTGQLSGFDRSRLASVLDGLSDTPGEQSHAATTFQIFLNWCVGRGYLDANPIAGLRRVGKVNKRERTLSDDELKAVWHALGDDTFSTILRLLILTGQRRSEVEHFILDGDTITIPGEHTKNHRTHTFPVGPLTKQHYRAVSFNGWSKAKKQLDERCKLPHWTLHDLRRTFASNHARLGTPIHVVEKLLNHTSGSLAGVAGIYNRYEYQEEMRMACDNYEERLASLL